VRERTDKLVRELVLENSAPFVPMTMKKRGKEADYEAKTVLLAGRRYIVCRNHQEAQEKPQRPQAPRLQPGVGCGRRDLPLASGCHTGCTFEIPSIFLHVNIDSANGGVLDPHQVFVFPVGNAAECCALNATDQRLERQCNQF
jgi:hypothetical protein